LAPTYYFVLQQSFCALPDDLDQLAEMRAPLTLLVGEMDEVFYAERFAPLLCPLRPDISIEVLPGVDHMAIIVQSGQSQRSSLRSNLLDRGRRSSQEDTHGYRAAPAHPRRGRGRLPEGRSRRLP
jgi:hypothetical protein